MNLRQLIGQFHTWRTEGRPMVMATVVHTTGSTYAKTGEIMLFETGGGSAGLLSGGCLEPDLFEHAQSVAAGDAGRLVTYDMRNRDEDELWGLGLGCDGLMRVLLQRIDRHNAYQPFAAIADAMTAGKSGVLVLNVDPAAAASLGQSAFLTADGATDIGLGTRLIEQIGDSALAAGRTHCRRHRLDGDDLELLFMPLRPPLRLLLLGAGPDAVPVMKLAQDLGWHVAVADHRQGYLSRDAYRSADALAHVVPADLPTLAGLGEFDAVVVMSHHLASDRDYLRALAQTGIGYIGLLGPPARRRRLLDQVEATPEFSARVRGPVGLDIGARGPDAIALSIVAEIHSELCRHE